MVPNYGAALWWACMDATTMEATYIPLRWWEDTRRNTTAGMGMMMFPLFTVYVTNMVQRYNKKSTSRRYSSQI